MATDPAARRVASETTFLCRIHRCLSAKPPRLPKGSDIQGLTANAWVTRRMKRASVTTVLSLLLLAVGLWVRFGRPPLDPKGEPRSVATPNRSTSPTCRRGQRLGVAGPPFVARFSAQRRLQRRLLRRPREVDDLCQVARGLERQLALERPRRSGPVRRTKAATWDPGD